MSTHKRGFTTIELLVVIAIIGILAALILVVVNSARDKTVDGKIKSDLRQMRVLAEIAFVSQNFTYAGWSSDQSIQSDFNTLVSDLNSIGVELEDLNVGEAATDSFCVSAPLRSNSSLHYCVDATGGATVISNPCPTSPPHLCPSS